MNKYKYTLFVCWAHEWKQVEFESNREVELNKDGFYIFYLPDQLVYINKNNIVQMNEEVLHG